MGIMLPSMRTLLVAVALATYATHTEAMQAVPGQVGRPFNELTKGIYPLAESGHPSILSRNFGQSLWATFRMKTILSVYSRTCSGTPSSPKAPKLRPLLPSSLLMALAASPTFRTPQSTPTLHLSKVFKLFWLFSSLGLGWHS